LQLLYLALVGFYSDFVSLEFLLSGQTDDLDSIQTPDGQFHPGLADGHVLHVHVEHARCVQGFGLILVPGQDDLQIAIGESNGNHTI